MVGEVARGLLNAEVVAALFVTEPTGSGPAHVSVEAPLVVLVLVALVMGAVGSFVPVFPADARPAVRRPSRRAGARGW